MGLRIFSKITCVATLFLIFAGGMVKSTNSGLSVPDWPLSYGMLFPPMVGGVFYEHGHRMIATVVGFFMLCLALWIGFQENRKWVKGLSFFSLFLVILQGVLGGITVLYFLPDPISIAHGVMAQIFFVLTIIIAYSFSKERKEREENLESTPNIYANFLKLCIAFIILIFIQLFVAAIVRHTESGLAIPDFPKMGGYWIPLFNESMLLNINDWRFDYNLDDVTIGQVLIHFLHRFIALIICILMIPLNKIGLKYYSNNPKMRKTIYWLDGLVVFQILLGIGTIYTAKEPWTTSFHVAIGAAILGIAVLLFLRVAPLKMDNLKEKLCI
ncbi:Heme A synthase, cytochrome oxidase biogenesis protein Cox15-CtaA [hydrothermal vent metagenome]|uniref:Heme A synthase, cytochrome oxidase biogenesis protein Cox15-CtaA n=1 Tax=hydrothermal vent metagenome TaxID=652676 RepID=A0A3B1DG56_9ZZZZ